MRDRWYPDSRCLKYGEVFSIITEVCYSWVIPWSNYRFRILRRRFGRNGPRGYLRLFFSLLSFGVFIRLHLNVCSSSPSAEASLHRVRRTPTLRPRAFGGSMSAGILLSRHCHLRKRFCRARYDPKPYIGLGQLLGLRSAATRTGDV